MGKRIGAFLLSVLLVFSCILPGNAQDLIIEEPEGGVQGPEISGDQRGDEILLEIEEVQLEEEPENQQWETQQSESQEVVIQQSETQELETQQSESQEAVIQQSEPQELETQQSESQEAVIQQSETQEMETQQPQTWQTELQSESISGSELEVSSLTVDSVTEVETKDYTGETVLESCVVTVEETIQECGEADDASSLRFRSFSSGSYTGSWGAQLSSPAKSVYDRMVSAFISQNSTAEVECTLVYPFTFTTSGTVVGNNNIDWDKANNAQYQLIQTDLAVIVQSACDAFAYDYPEAFWLGKVKYTYEISFSGSAGTYTGTINAVTIIPEEKYPGAFGEIQSFQNAVAGAVSQIQVGLQGKTDRYYILKAIHDYICGRVVYGENAYAHTAAGVFIKNNQVVCEGYAKAFRILAKKFGIDSPLIVGMARSGGGSEAHMWNYVQMEDGVWYLVDATWDDQQSGIVYTYFLVGSGDQGFVYTIGQERTPYTNFSGVSTTKSFTLPSLGAGTYHFWESEAKLTNCEGGGKIVYRCKYCQAVKEENVSSGVGTHQWDSGQITKNATCTANGKIVYHCTRCSQGVKEESIPATGHKAGSWTVTRAASCTQAGSRSQLCSTCGAVVATQAISATGHKAGAWKVTLQASCTKSGKKSRSCTVCGALLESQTVKALGHSWGKYKVTQKATALKTGVKIRTCSRCRASQKAKISKLTPYIKVSAASILLKKGQSTSALKVTGMAQGDKVKSWKSSNTKIVKVSSKGKLTAQKKTGKATVTVTLYSGIKKKITVKVQSGTVKTTGISGVPSSLRIAKGKTSALKPVRKPLTSQQKLTYQSSNKKVATVSSKGVIRAKGAGTAKITVKSGSKKVVVKVTVPKTKTKKITNVPSKLTLKKGKTKVLKPKRSPSGSDEKITYKSSNRKVAVVSSGGKITAKKKGTAVITVTSGSISVKCRVTVK
ncbi:MAG TPA: Ig-like domain-containing protein [Candidatus Choladousia intestinigallinarum]|nr:Ig-like domain-containing protein [Candidatus Choladousia intestinigallinarum]